MTVADLDLLALEGDHALDQVALGLATDLVQHDDVAAIRVVQTVRELVDEHPVAGVQRGEHRVAVDDEVGEQERPHQDRHESATPTTTTQSTNARVVRGMPGATEPLAAGLPRLFGCPAAGVDVVVVDGFVTPQSRYRNARRSWDQSDSISFSTRSSRLLNGSLQSTVRCA